MSTYPDDRRYSRDHEWIAVDGDTARIGVTVHAATSLGDAVYVDLPDVGDRVTAGEACGEIESTKSVSDLVAPGTGRVTAVNAPAVDDPALITADPHGTGWLYEIAVESVPDLLDAAGYERLVTEAG